ncbi:hypothetical protein SEA_YAVRU_22 [Arthrobacter phage Yavru]|uniref:Uncharacterized protein n=1 Tax=Arthrobacter phage Yavru TaxID=2776857 RepID=A0A7M1CKJ4_9CAUD|nr:hypothetical protein QEX70_gp22 [Arthrobacter phage Yavru]QOP64233.1 hypothetical protein SEA_YAVRU_22 [Arthrobacter phage Yavru]
MKGGTPDNPPVCSCCPPRTDDPAADPEGRQLVAAILDRKAGDS